MAYVTLPGQPGDIPTILGPLSLRQSLGSVVYSAWISKGPHGNDPAFVRELVRQILDDALRWWKYLGADVFKIDGARLTEGVDASVASLSDIAQILMRQGVQQCWEMLPVSRRNDEEVRRVIERMLDQLFAQVQQDFEEFAPA
jgi:hypothetical protein